ncbi:3-hydroxyacyl-ACP dehydratase FabZ [Gorillibacterium sp. sgz500922]|uniref:3-hydroxyacyl-ACP dehydratase FabZ n=1 Tax=Gorillibacterium sp. sgz500922 TaxID=3446694 RepID=UPI003F671083
MDSKSIMGYFPQRFPFLMVDRVLEIRYMESSKGAKNVSMNEPWVVGHFPDEPLFPGAMIVETMGQIGGLIFCDPESDIRQRKGYLCGADKLKFIRKVVPGDVLVVEAQLVESIAHMARVKCVAKVSDQVVASGLLSYAFAQ